MDQMEMLKFAVENGMLDTALVQEKYEMKRRKQILDGHPYKITLGPDGYWRTYVKDGERKMIRHKKLEDVEEDLVKFYLRLEDDPTLLELFTEYNDRRLASKNISQASHLRYQQDFNRFLGKIAYRKVRYISADYLCEYIESLFAEMEISHKAFSGFKTMLRDLFTIAYRRKYVDYHIQEDVLNMLLLGDKVFSKKRKSETEDAFSESEYARYKEYLAENMDIWNAALLLILISGLRNGEVVSLTYNDLKIYDTCAVIWVCKTETRYKDCSGEYVYAVRDDAKTHAGNRPVIVPREYIWLVRWLMCGGSGDDYVFNSPKTGKRMTTNSLRRRQERNCKKLGIIQKSPHKGRKTYGSILLDNNADKKMITGQMGHTTIDTTEKYYHRDIKSRDKKAEIINRIFTA